MISRLLTFLSIGIFLSCNAFAQVAFDAGGVNGGAIVLGESSEACTSTIDGALRYDNGTKKLQLCNGSTWDDVNQGCDTVPDGFDFTDVTNVALGSTQTTSIEEITGVTCPLCQDSCRL